MYAFCAPARRPFEVLHVAEPGADFHAPAGCEALTLCGLIMTRDELWLPFDRETADELCATCSGVWWAADVAQWRRAL